VSGNDDDAFEFLKKLRDEKLANPSGLANDATDSLKALYTRELAQRVFNDTKSGERLTRMKQDVMAVHQLDDLEDPCWRVHGLLPEAAVTMMYGANQAGKSIVMLDWALSLAAGAESWLGVPLGKRAKVLWIIGEGLLGTKKRVAAWCAERERKRPGPDWFMLLPMAGQLDDPARIAELGKNIAEVVGFIPDLIVVDTLSAVAPSAERSDRAPEFMVAFESLRAACSDTATLVFLHHTQRADPKRFRNSGALEDNAGFSLSVRGAPGPGLREIKVTKSKDSDLITMFVRFDQHPETDSVVQRLPDVGEVMPPEGVEGQVREVVKVLSAVGWHGTVTALRKLVKGDNNTLTQVVQELASLGCVQHVPRKPLVLLREPTDKEIDKIVSMVI
jgi:hypothetical protein